MNGELVCWRGRIMEESELEIPLGELLTSHYVYQWLHALAHRPLNLAAHLEIARRSLRSIYGIESDTDEATVAAEISELLKLNRYPARGSATVLLNFIVNEDRAESLVLCGRPLIGKGYTVSSLRPVAVCYEYGIPYSAFPTGFQLSAARMHDALALQHGATRSVRREGNRLISCGESPLFGIRGKTLFTAPLTDGATDSVERHTVISAAAKARMDFLEEAVPHSELKEFDELFYADAAGITSLSECDGAKFMSLLVERLINNF